MEELVSRERVGALPQLDKRAPAGTCLVSECCFKAGRRPLGGSLGWGGEVGMGVAGFWLIPALRGPLSVSEAYGPTGSHAGWKWREGGEALGCCKVDRKGLGDSGCRQLQKLTCQETEGKGKQGENWWWRQVRSWGWRSWVRGGLR